MKLDASTVTNLELVQTLDGSKKGSLLSFLDLTRTGMGARLLKSWMLLPLLNIAELERRQDAIQALTAAIPTHGRLAGRLTEIRSGTPYQPGNDQVQSRLLASAIRCRSFLPCKCI
jgi:DNA mismatch repair protein MutS